MDKVVDMVEPICQIGNLLWAPQLCNMGPYVLYYA